MKNILVLIGRYKPYLSPTGIIADNIVQELKKQGYNVIVLSRQDKKSIKTYEILDNVPVYRIIDLNYIIHNYCQDKIKNEKNIFKIVLFIKRVVFYMQRLLRRQSVSKRYIKKIEEKIRNINNEHHIDAMIPVFAPHEEVFAAMRFKQKNPDIKFLPYQLDRFANDERLYLTKILKSIVEKNNLKLEEEMIKTCDKLFMLQPIYSHYATNKVFASYLDKIIITEHPLVKNMKSNKQRQDNTIKLLYAGALYINLRNPTYLLKILDSENAIKSNIKFNLYTSSTSCQKILNEYKHKLKGIMNLKKSVKHEVIVEKMKEADILLTIGNNSSEELPSKLFEYLSFCKPIIHLYYTEKDAYIKYLKDYKYSICIKMDESKLKENTKKFYDFCNRNSNVDIKFENVYKKFKECTPEYVTNQFIKEIGGINE